MDIIVRLTTYRAVPTQGRAGGMLHAASKNDAHDFKVECSSAKCEPDGAIQTI